MKKVQLGPKKVEIPATWRVKQVQDIIETVSTKKAIKKRDYAEHGKYPIVDQSSQKIAGYANEKALVNHVEPVIVFGDHSRQVKYVDFPFIVGADGTKILQTKEEKMEFVYQALKQNEVQSRGYQRHFKYLKEKKIPLPPLEEQKRIATILTTIDDLIEKTERVIQQTQRVKKGLMQDLLTKGLGHTEFKEVQLGPKTVQIPQEWELKRVKEITNYIKSGGTPKSTNEEYYSGRIPFVKIEDMTEAGPYLETTKNHITEEAIVESSTWNVPEGKLLFSIYGSYGKVTINKVPVCTNQAILALETDEETSQTYTKYALESMKWFFDSVTKATTQANLTKKIVSNTKLITPPLEEQKRIATILNTIDKKIQKEKEEKEKIQQLKKGLMQSLLTGKVRVDV